ncbi:MAG TPA: TonB-dependent receptor [Terriglobales bacterium]|nr:TonB-dependent receptor [Terriglobales bacterium]
MKLYKPVVWLFVFLLLAGIIWAQSSTTSIRGTVSDEKGAVIPNAEVIIQNPATAFQRTGKTDAQGAYQFVQLPPGTYTVQVAYPGFAASKHTVQLLVDTTGTLNVTLGVEKTSTTIEVGAEAPLVNTQDATVGNAFNTTQVMSLPFEGRDPVGILSLQAGVAFVGDNVDPAQDSRNGAVAGARSDQTNVTLDGVDNNDQHAGMAFQGALRSTLDSLQEFRVTTVGANADAGRSSGGQVSLVTKSGTNQLHGSLYEYHRPTFTTANDWFNKRTQLERGQENRAPKLIRNTFGASLGGPIKKDRAFFFFNYEGQRTRENVVVTRYVPSMSLRQGIMKYQTCAGVSGECDTNNYNVATLTALDVTALDPLHLGPNPAILNILRQYPEPNSNAVGDGLNIQGYTFSAPNPAKLDTYIGKLDFNLTNNGAHRLFVRGNLQNDNESEIPQWDGTAPSSTRHWNNKGVAVGYTAMLGANWVNNFRYGFVRPGNSRAGIGQGHYVDLRGLDNLESETRNSSRTFPVHNFVNDTTWVKGNHTVQFGQNLRLLSNKSLSDINSWFWATTNTSYFDGSGIANTGMPGDPATVSGMAPVASFFETDYDWPLGILFGAVGQIDGTYNRDKSGKVLPEGTPTRRHYKSYELEFYAQDAWRIKPNLTVTAGVRYTLLQPPYEATGLQVAPTIDMGSWYRSRYENMLVGKVNREPIEFDLSGQANGKKPYWAWDKINFAPRLAIAYSPNFEQGLFGKLFGGPGKSSIRLGYGMYYDHFGEGIINTFDQNGAFGLTSTTTNSSGVLSLANAPRLTSLHDVPTTDYFGNALLQPPPADGWPVRYPDDAFAITWGMDDHLKTPYAHVFDFSVTRELPKNFVFEATYVGRLAHRLLQQDDLAMPLNLVDPQSKMDYFTAAQALGRMVSAGTPIDQVAPIPYWENLFPGAAGSYAAVGAGCASGAPANLTATQAIYDLFACVPGNETLALMYLDLYGFPAFPRINGEEGPYNFFDDQFSSLYSWRSIGVSSYHGGMFSLRRRMTNGLQFDLNYTLSKSIDMGSDAERISTWQGPGGQIINSWNPRQNRGVSDFDTRHQINSNWMYELPFGQGKKWGSSWRGVRNALLGGWGVSGVFRWTSAYPFNVSNGANWATNWQLGGNAVLVGEKPETGAYMVDGEPNLFKDPKAAVEAFRYAMPGEGGTRNVLRGTGYFGIDMGVSKTWKVAEGQTLKFRGEVFNLTNSVRFDGSSASVPTSISSISSFGKFNNTLTNKRVMQFALRYEF